MTEDSGGRCVLVGLPLGSDGKGLLQWALTAAVSPGDRIVAVHIYRNSGSGIGKANALSLIKALDEFLLEFEHLCHAKRVTLVGRVTPSGSINKALVKEAQLCAAALVIVGVNRSYSFGGPSSLAKYIARQLPDTVAVVAIHGGRVVFKREAVREQHPVLRTVLHPSVGMGPAAVVVPNPKRQQAMSMDLDAIPGRLSAPLTPRTVDLPENQLGWPLLRATSDSSAAQKGLESCRKLSVVQWAMRLPTRPLASPEPQAELIEELKRRTESSAAAGCVWFQYDELRDATDGFSSGNLIGKGGGGQVYRGQLPGTGDQVAVKVSKLEAEAARNFLLEVDIVSQLRHDGIVPLIGICVDSRNLVSVYKYLPKGSLQDNLHGRQAKTALTWAKRAKAARGIAEALNYLHSGHPRPVIHRDVKSSNILLTDDFKTQLSDFGLAIWGPSNSPFLTLDDVFGTFGYMAPEYFMYGKVSTKIDVYAFGVVLLELLTGKKPINESGGTKESLVMWATRTLNSGDVKDIMDPNLDGGYNELEARRMARAAALSLTRAARFRPPMSEILSILEGRDNRGGGCGDEDQEADAAEEAAASVRTHLDLALGELAEDWESVSSAEPGNNSSLEDYLRGRWSRSSSFD